MNSNLPAGAANDPNNPWDDSEKYCRNCESEAIGEMVDQFLGDNPEFEDWDEAYEKLDNMGSFGLCRHCYWEEKGEWGND